MASSIPPRSSSRFAGQYSGTIDAQRMLEIFSDSVKIALSSKNPETAISRYELAIEAFHQAVSMPLPAETKASLNDSMERLAESFPTQVLVNEAVGLAEKAAKLKTPKKRLDLLQRAVAVVEVGLRTYPRNPQLRAVHEGLHVEVAKVAGSTPD